jgi:large subunit ribosomal protein L35
MDHQLLSGAQSRVGNQLKIRAPHRRCAGSPGANRWSQARPICFNSVTSMPKMKTHSGAKKRFHKTASGKILARHAFTSHNMGKKAAKRKRRLGRPVEITAADSTEVKKLLAGGKGAQ